MRKHKTHSAASLTRNEAGLSSFSAFIRVAEPSGNYLVLQNENRLNRACIMDSCFPDLIVPKLLKNIFKFGAKIGPIRR